ncbi:hypothetical protein B484DRAFT_443853 [Ochromonadaceae sp. CCMP2298]|nr:hypothetical protein B484DRAFT_457829 [Ochromonadaceae sp. CCMP2298]KAJ1439685.1 hypothetical protein B484DRAFT_443853 [Ochromonadaceae sp. CCMP2298]
MASLPVISPGNKYMGGTVFTIRMDCINDLFYEAGSNDPEEEILKVQSVLNANNSRLQTLYANAHSRSSFKTMAGSKVGAHALIAADEIFSCCTNLYGDGTGAAGKDTNMSAASFAGAVVRLANLRWLMQHGMAGSSDLALHTQSFLQEQ